MPAVAADISPSTDVTDPWLAGGGKGGLQGDPHGGPHLRHGITAAATKGCPSLHMLQMCLVSKGAVAMHVVSATCSKGVGMSFSITAVMQGLLSACSTHHARKLLMQALLYSI